MSIMMILLPFVIPGASCSTLKKAENRENLQPDPGKQVFSGEKTSARLDKRGGQDYFFIKKRYLRMHGKDRK